MQWGNHFNSKCTGHFPLYGADLPLASVTLKANCTRIGSGPISWLGGFMLIESKILEWFRDN